MNNCQINHETLNAVCQGNTLLIPVSSKRLTCCSSCDCEGGHWCVVCGRDMTPQTCKKNDGLCVDCIEEASNE